MGSRSSTYGREPAPGASRPGHVEIGSVTCFYGRRAVVSNADLDIAGGEHVAIIGSNGSGKSTLLRTIGGLHREFRGTVTFDGTIATARTSRQLCAWVPQRQNPGGFPLRVGELLDSSGDPAAARRASSALHIDGLLRRPLGSLSGGQLQRAFVARALGALCAGPNVLLADEPTAALDFDGQAEIARILGELDATVIVATHDRAVADACDRRFEMAAGAIRQIA